MESDEGESSTEYFDEEEHGEKSNEMEENEMSNSLELEKIPLSPSPSMDRLKDTFKAMTTLPEEKNKEVSSSSSEKEVSEDESGSEKKQNSGKQEQTPPRVQPEKNQKKRGSRKRTLHKKSRSESSIVRPSKSLPNDKMSPKLAKKRQAARRRSSVVSRIALWEQKAQTQQNGEDDKDASTDNYENRLSKIFEDEKRVQSVILDQLHQISELEIENELLRKKVEEQQNFIERLKSQLASVTNSPRKKKKKKKKQTNNNSNEKNKKKGKGSTFSWSFRSFKKLARKDQEIRKERKNRSLGGYSDFWHIKDLSFVLDNLKKDFQDHFEKGNKISKNSRQINKIQEVEYTKIVDLGRPDDPHGKIRVLATPEMKKMYVHSLIPGCKRVFDAKLIQEKTTFRDVAIKKFALHNKQDALRVLEELNFNVTLSSKHITGVTGYHVHWAKLPEVGIVMEKMDFDVSQFILDYDNIRVKHRSRTNDLPEKLSDGNKFLIMYKMVKCLAFVHSMGVVHRDVKGKNFLIRIKLHHSKTLKPENFMIKLADFGLSKKLGKRGIYVSSTSGGGKGKGTNYWLAPELIRVSGSSTGRSRKIVYSFQSDIYALGITFWEVLAETIPYSNYDYEYYDSFSPLTERNLLRDIAVKGLRPRVEGVIRDIRFLELLERCWTGDLNERFLDMDQVESWFDANRGYFLRDTT